MSEESRAEVWANEAARRAMSEPRVVTIKRHRDGSLLVSGLPDCTLVLDDGEFERPSPFALPGPGEAAVSEITEEARAPGVRALVEAMGGAMDQARAAMAEAHAAMEALVAGEQYRDRFMQKVPWALVGLTVDALVAEVKRLRAENERLRAETERSRAKR